MGKSTNFQWPWLQQQTVNVYQRVIRSSSLLRCGSISQSLEDFQLRPMFLEKSPKRDEFSCVLLHAYCFLLIKHGNRHSKLGDSSQLFPSLICLISRGYPLTEVFPWIIFPFYPNDIRSIIFPSCVYMYYIYAHDIPVISISPFYSHDIPIISQWYSHYIPMIFPYTLW